MKNELYHHGVKGMKWGVWNDETKARYRNSFSKDVTYEKGTKFYRTTTAKNEKFNKRTYVSTDPNAYGTDGLFDKPVTAYKDTYVSNKDALIAGKETINKILEDIGYKKLEDLETDDAMWNKVGKMSREEIEEYKKKYTPNDFLYDQGYAVKYGFYDEKRADKFVDELRKRGYDGLKDPSDYRWLMNKAHPTILVNDILDKVGSVPISELNK